MNAPTRPALRYLGGKWKLAPKIVHHLPPHRVYVEPFGGAASVLLRKSRSYAEIYNDLDDEVVNLFQVLRAPASAAELMERVRLTPFSRTEFELAYCAALDPVDMAHKLIVRSFMGHGSTAVGKRTRTGFRADSNRSGTTPARDWSRLPPALAAVVERIAGVVIERRPALDIIDRFGAPDAVIYCDPPYLQSTRSQKRNAGLLECAYEHELTDADHAELLAALLRTRGMVLLSGYASSLYDDALAGWRRIEIDAHADGARPRVEVLWINPAACAAHGLFGAAA